MLVFPDETYFQAFEHGLEGIGEPPWLLDAEDAVGHAVAEDGVEEFQFHAVDVDAQGLDFAVVVQVGFLDGLAAAHEFGDEVEALADVELQSLVGRQGRSFCFFQFLLHEFNFLLDDMVEYHPLTVKMRVKRATAYFRGRGDILHGRLVKTHVGEQFLCHVDDFLSCRS